MNEIIKKIFNYWGVWHMLLACYAFVIVYAIWADLQIAFLAVLALAIVYEASEWLWNRGAYSSNKVMLLDNIKDVGYALLAIFIMAIIFKGV